MLRRATARRLMIRLTCSVAIMTGLLMSSGAASAIHIEVGPNECGNGECATDPTRRLTVFQPVSFPGGPFDPRFEP